MKTIQSIFSRLNLSKLMLTFVFLSAAAFSNASFSDEQVAPDQVVKNTVDAVVKNIQENRVQYQQDINALYQMLEETLVPALHVDRMSNLILGKQYSRSATAEQKADFAEAFKISLMKTYAAALLEYTGDQKVIYKPVVAAPGADKVKVRADLVSETGDIYAVTLSMSNRKDTRWRAYNMEVAGINLVATYRATFGDILDTKGIDGLIEDLRSKNARL